MIKTIVYDVGNVLMDWNKRALCSRIFAGDEEAAQFAYDHAFHTDLWFLGDSGNYTLEEVAALMGKGMSEQEKAILLKGCLDFKYHVIKNEAMIAFLKENKKKGYKTYLLSNYSENFLPSLKTLGIDVEKDLDGYVYSHEVKAMKPEHKIYEILQKKYDLDLSTCLFIDDFAPNLEAAKEVGFGYTFQYLHNTEELIRYLQENGMK